MIRKSLLIALVLGLASGIGLRKVLPEPDEPNTASPETTAPKRRKPTELSAHSMPLGWSIDGRMSLAEIKDLPEGGRRTAEMVLWLQSASLDQLAARWDELVAEGVSSRTTGPDQKQLMMVWVARDPKGAEAHLNGDRQMFSFFTALAKEDPDEALRLVEGKSRYLQETVLYSLAQSDPFKVMKWLQDRDERPNEAIREGIVDGLMKQDPRAALEYLGEEKVYGRSGHCLKEWALHDPEAALEWALNGTSVEIDAAADVFWQRIPETFAERVESLPTGTQKSSLMESQARWVARTDPAAAVRLADEQEGRTRARMMEGVLSQIAGTGHELVPDLLEEVMDWDRLNPHPEFSLVFNGWAQQELQSQPSRFLSLAESHHPAVVPHALATWKRSDEPAMRAWISEDPKRARFVKSETEGP